MKKRFFVLAVALIVLAFATACGSNESNSTPTPTTANSQTNNDAQITATSAPTEAPSTPTPSVKEYTVSEYLKTGETIWFGVQEYVSKSSHVTGIYVFESNGTYRAAVPKNGTEFPTLGELSNMSDQDIIKLVDDYISDTSHYAFDSSVLTDAEYNTWADFILNGDHKYAFSYFTDNTGNNINFGMLWLEEMVPMAYYYKDLNKGGDFETGSNFSRNVINRFVVSKYSAADGVQFGRIINDQVVYQATYMGVANKEDSFMFITKNPGDVQLVLDSDINNGFLIDKTSQQIFEERIIFDTAGVVSYGLKLKMFCESAKDVFIALMAYSDGYGSLDDLKNAVNNLDGGRGIFEEAELERILSSCLENKDRFLAIDDFYDTTKWEWFGELVFK